MEFTTCLRAWLPCKFSKNIGCDDVNARGSLASSVKNIGCDDVTHETGSHARKQVESPATVIFALLPLTYCPNLTHTLATRMNELIHYENQSK